MKTRQEIKLQAKTNMGKQRGTAILMILLAAAAGFVIGLLLQIPYIGYVLYIAGMVAIMAYAVSVSRAYTSIYKDETVAIGKVISDCGITFWRNVGGMLWMALWTFLWSLLFCVPGIIKSYAYSMTPYILAHCPNVSATDALKLSMRMTNGHKGELFVMHLSFIGWMLLGALTLGILVIVHVGPYMGTTTAGYYIELRDEALAKGIIRPEELGMAAQS